MSFVNYFPCVCFRALLWAVTSFFFRRMFFGPAIRDLYILSTFCQVSMMDDCFLQVQERTKEAEELLLLSKVIPEICGKRKLVKKLEAEIRFLKKLSSSTSISPNHVKCSNLPHLSAIISCCLEMDGVVKILESFDFYLSSGSNSMHKRVVIDVVCDSGRTWVKVVARNSSALVALSRGNGKFGQKYYKEQVVDMIECAKQNMYMYEIPCIKVWFCSNFIQEVKDHMLDMNVEVLFSNESSCCNKPVSSASAATTVESTYNLNFEDNVLRHSQCTSDCFSHSSFTECSLTLCSVPQNAVLNLDISTMIAYVSNLTNGHANANFEDAILCQQANRELVSPVRNVFTNLFKGHKLVCCSTACSKFKDIISHIGGNAEKERASFLLEQLEIVPDNPSDKAIRLEETSKIKSRAKIIFGTGDTCKAITVTANCGFLRAAEGQDVFSNKLPHHLPLQRYTNKTKWHTRYFKYDCSCSSECSITSQTAIYATRRSLPTEDPKLSKSGCDTTVYGVKFMAVFHESRALSEVKELSV